jgi:leucyl-tRNA synthetase
MSEEKAKQFNGATKSEIESAEKRRAWLPVTSYIGGAEHSVLHLLYARFITMALKDMGYMDFEEPFSRFYAHGLIIKDGAKMSKSKGNIINPDEYIRKYGADTLRTYLLFLGPFNQGGDFRDSGIDGMNRFLKRVWKLLSSEKSEVESDKSQERLRMMHQTIKGITEDMDNLRFNTAIAKLMTWYNFLVKQESVSREEVETYLQLLAPFAPHMTEELWAAIGKPFSIHTSDYPTYDEKYLEVDTVTIAVQVNGKLRGTLTVSVDEGNKKDLLEKMVRDDEQITRFFIGNIRKVIFVPGKILNFVVH